MINAEERDRLLVVRQMCVCQTDNDLRKRITLLEQETDKDGYLLRGPKLLVNDLYAELRRRKHEDRQ